MKYTNKNIVIAILIIIIAGAVIWSTISKKTEVKEKATVVTVSEKVKIEPIDMCYERFEKTARGFYDKALIKMQITGDKVIGEFRDIPAEKDSKVGKFEGTVGPLDQKTMSRRASLWWDSEAEGMSVKEELIIDFGDGSAVAGYGEMIEKETNVYVYKDNTKLTFSKSMSQIDCGTLDEKINVEKYIRDNIATIVKEKAVLGGSWYVVSVFINPSGKKVDVTYEDGHIQNKAQFTYTYIKGTGTIDISVKK